MKRVQMTHVLVIDDDQDIRHSLRFLLQDAGFEVLEAGDGETALEALRASPDRLVALVDLLMSGMSGVEVLDAVADDPGLRGRHAYIVVTADNRALLQSAEPSMRRLSAGVVQKPFNVDDLLAAVEDARMRLGASA